MFVDPMASLLQLFDVVKSCRFTGASNGILIPLPSVINFTLVFFFYLRNILVDARIVVGIDSFSVLNDEPQSIDESTVLLPWRHQVDPRRFNR